MPTIDDRTPQAKFDELISLAVSLMDQTQVPGVGIALVMGDDDLTAGLGVTSLTNPLPVTPETLFQIGSTTKTFTATAIMRLVDQGKLGLDDRVRKFIPDFRVSDETAAAGATLRHLLTHTCGWLGDYFPDTGWGDDALARYVALMCDLPQKTPLGAYYSYNNAALVLAGRVIEIVTGQPYETALRELVLEPLGMMRSYFFPGEVMLHRFAVGHVLEGEQVTVADPWPIGRFGHPAGGVTTDLNDQIRYLRFHMGDGATLQGPRLLSPVSMRLMQTPLVPTGDGDWVGLTWTVEDTGGVRFISHGGTTNGQESDFWLAPQEKIGMAVVTNLDQGNLLHQPLRAWVREHFLGVVRQNPKTERWPAEKLAGYTAEFLTSAGDLLRLTPQDGGLLVQHVLTPPPGESEAPGEPLPPMRAEFYAPDRFMVLDPPFENARAEFLRRADGEIGWLRINGRILSRK